MHVAATWTKPSLPNTTPSPRAATSGNFRSRITLLLMPDLGFSSRSLVVITDTSCQTGVHRCSLFTEKWYIGLDRKYILCHSDLDANCSQFQLRGVPRIHGIFYWQRSGKKNYPKRIPLIYDKWNSLLIRMACCCPINLTLHYCATGIVTTVMQNTRINNDSSISNITNCSLAFLQFDGAEKNNKKKQTAKVCGILKRKAARFSQTPSFYFPAKDVSWLNITV